MKKLLLGSVAALSVASFSPAQAQENSMDGFYAGLYGGYAWADTDNSAGADPEPTGFDYGIFGGYKVDSAMRDAGIGITGAVEVSWGGSLADDTVGGVEIEKGREFGLSFRPGINLMESGLNPYGIIGYRNTQFEASSGGLSTDENYHGFELGLGADLLQFDDFGVRAEYSYVWYAEEDNINPSEGDLRIGLTYGF